MENQKIAQIFQEIGDMLEITGDSVFKIRSYHRAAQVVANYPYHLRDIYEKDPKLLDKIPGIGKSLMGKIIEILDTGDCKKHLQLVKQIKPGLLDIMKLRGIGPKKTKLFHDELSIDSVAKLKSAAKRGLIRELSGMGEKSESEVLKSIESYGRLKARIPMYEALDIAEEIISYMKKSDAVSKVEYAGSLRRRLETVGDVDILACGDKPEEIIKYFCDFPFISHIESRGNTKTTVILENGMQVDLRVVSKDDFGAALYYFTGSKAHNITTRKIAQKMGLKINEYGVFKGNKKIICRTEEDVFKAINLPYIIPEMREDTGETDFIKPIEISDIKGELHSHSDWSDGENTITEMAETAKKTGYEFIAITDHSASLKIAHGLDKTRLEAQIKEIETLNKKIEGIKILTGAEVDILRDGSLDLPDSILKKLDIVIASVHTYFRLTREEQTARIIKAISNPFVKIIGHPTGKLIGMREAYDIDLVKVMEAAKKHNVAIELNCNPKRLDLSAEHLRMAKDMGVMISLGTDSHGTSQLSYIKYGIFMARRGWLEKKNILNTMDYASILSSKHHE
ncbi:MAG: family X DNA polymerase IV, DNA polymerase (family X) [Candidatus Peregrinibacteria bacterium GW2011_GWF2_43_17]|nr:MAG: family X DNA polymerase IV, DNA polymerase (family X) [Candidatus Peregrinibacteria bacterium GW2011_GWF2_43_17]KKT20202.1 MAG: polymerase IV, family X protein [Candidatus Peregrinibacteria bacterium GW2011_GWA2_43_8]HAU39763.1 DNA polymerase/3'-5' exonuclease PolX [Candidatus Peregrinibacteria bacterium]